VLEVHKDPLARMATRIDVGGGPNELHAANVCAAGYPACQVNKNTHVPIDVGQLAVG
jgi:hypothetical protein